LLPARLRIGAFNLSGLFFTLFIAAVAGDSFNLPWKGIGQKMVEKHSRLLRRNTSTARTILRKIRRKTIILARFVPVVDIRAVCRRIEKCSIALPGL